VTSVFPVEISPEAIAHFKKMRERKDQPEAMFRIGVKGGGCSGLEYVMKMEAAARESDLSVEIDGVTVLCDPKSATFLAGSRLVYTGNLMSGGGFQFENPNAARSCGCGTSFVPKR
jgi:iron-sulfur cluster assembly protein